MAARAASFYPYEDPWRASAFCFAFTQLVITVLVLIHTILVCVTFQLMKWHGWRIPFWDGGYRPGVSTHFDPCAPTKNSSEFDFKENRSSPLIRTERVLKRSRSDSCRSLKSRPAVCLRCHGVWNRQPSLSSESAMGASCKWGEPTCSDGGDSSSAKGSCEEAEVRSEKARGVKAYGTVDELDTMSKAESRADLRSSMSASVERLRSLVRQATSRNMEKLEASQVINGEEQVDGMDSLLVGSSGSGSKRICWKNEGLGKTHQLNGRMGSFHNPPCQLEEIQNEIGTVLIAEDCFVSFEGKCDSKDLDSEAVIRGLRDALQRERRKLGTLYAELEVERIASETAANEAMAMISRLQEDKATLRMQAAHYQRMVEEKAIHDDQALQLLKEILYKKERENYLLEKEVKVIRARFGRDGRRLSRRRKGLEAVLHDHARPLKDVEEASEGTGSSIQAIEVKGEPAMLPCSSSHASEEQPLKRRKGGTNDDSMDEQSLSLRKISDDVASLEPFFGENSHAGAPNMAAQPSILANSNGNHASFGSRAVNAYLQDEETVKGVEDVEKMTNAMNGTDDKSIIELLSAEVVRSPHLKEYMRGMVACKQSLTPKPIAGSQIVPLQNFCKVSGFHQSESPVHGGGENIYPNKQTSDELCSFAPCPANGTMGQASPGMVMRNGIHVCLGTRTNMALCPTTSPELQHCANAECLQSSLHDKESAIQDDTRRDLQARLQVEESNRMPPSSKQ